MSWNSSTKKWVKRCCSSLTYAGIIANEIARLDQEHTTGERA